MSIDPDDFERKSTHVAIARTLGFAGLLQLAHELIKRHVLDGPKQFYGFVQWDGGTAWSSDDAGADYDKHVLALDRNSRFNASLLWLQQSHAITAEDAERLARVKHHRDELTHRMAEYLVLPGSDADPSVLTDALEVFNKLNRFWIEVEFGYGTFDDHPDATADDVWSGPAAILYAAVEAFVALHVPD